MLTRLYVWVSIGMQLQGQSAVGLLDLILRLPRQEGRSREARAHWLPGMYSTPHLTGGALDAQHLHARDANAEITRPRRATCDVRKDRCPLTSYREGSWGMTAIDQKAGMKDGI